MLNSHAMLIGGALVASLFACARFTTGSNLAGTMRVTATAQLGAGGDTLYVPVALTHTGGGPVDLELRCNMTDVRLSGHGRSWDSGTWKRQLAAESAGRNEYRIGCMGEERRRVQPGERVYGYGLTVPVAAILGDSLPPGTYVVSARARLGNELVDNIPAGSITLPGAP